MLVLARKTNQRVVIHVGGERIEVLVVGMHGGQCKLGFTAPKHVVINREEVERKERVA